MTWQLIFLVPLQSTFNVRQLWKNFLILNFSLFQSNLSLSRSTWCAWTHIGGWGFQRRGCSNDLLPGEQGQPWCRAFCLDQVRSLLPWVEVISLHLRDGATLEQTSYFLLLPSVGPADKGNYSCSAVNSIGTGPSDELYLDVTGEKSLCNLNSQWSSAAPPAFLVDLPEQTTLELGGEITFLCHVECSPLCQLDWLVDGEVVEETEHDFGSDSCIDAIRFRFCTPALAAIGWCSVTVTFMYAEWILGAVVKAQLILLTASDFRRGKSRWVVVAKMKIGKKCFQDQFFHINFFKTTKST